MDKIRCYYKDSDGLHRIDVSDCEDCDSAIEDVKALLVQYSYYQPAKRVLAVVN